MTDYTDNISLRQPDVGDLQWDGAWGDNQQIVDGGLTSMLSANRVISGGTMAVFADITVEVAESVVFVGGEYVSVPLFWQTLTPASLGETDICWAYITADGTGKITTAPPPADAALIGLINVNGGGVFLLVDMRAIAYGDPFRPSVSGIDFTDLDLSAGVLTYTHNLDVDYPAMVAVWDNNKKLVEPDLITSISNNSISVALGSYGAISGTWHLSVRG